jgi:hypothetical protein
MLPSWERKWSRRRLRTLLTSHLQHTHKHYFYSIKYNPPCSNCTAYLSEISPMHPAPLWTRSINPEPSKDPTYPGFVSLCASRLTLKAYSSPSSSLASHWSDRPFYLWCSVCLSCLLICSCPFSISFHCSLCLAVYVLAGRSSSSWPLTALAVVVSYIKEHGSGTDILS